MFFDPIWQINCNPCKKLYISHLLIHITSTTIDNTNTTKDTITKAITIPTLNPDSSFSFPSPLISLLSGFTGTSVWEVESVENVVVDEMDLFFAVVGVFCVVASFVLIVVEGFFVVGDDVGVGVFCVVASSVFIVVEGFFVVGGINVDEENIVVKSNGSKI